MDTVHAFSLPSGLCYSFKYSLLLAWQNFLLVYFGGIMHKFILLLFIAFFMIAPLAAQDSPYLSTSGFADHEKGDGIFSLNLGTITPIFFVRDSAFYPPNSWPGFGFGLAYMGFLDENWMMGGQLSASFINTIAERRLFIAPISFRTAYSINLNPFFISPALGAGMIISSLGEYKHIDILFLAGSYFSWRINNDLSYGLNLFINIAPQIYKDREQSTTGFFIEGLFSVQYHM